MSFKLKTENEVYDTEEKENAETEKVISEKEQLYNHIFNTPKQCIMQLEFYINSYKHQKEGADFRLRHIKIRRNVCIATVIAMFFLCVALFGLTNRMIMGFSVYGIIAFVFLAIALSKSIEIMIDSIYSYGVHFEKPKYEHYIKKYNIFTIQDEKAHCDVEIMKLKKMIDEVKFKALENPKIDRRYFEYSYIEKYAETKVCHFFEEHSKAVVYVEIVFVFLVLLVVLNLLINSVGGLLGGVIF